MIYYFSSEFSSAIKVNGVYLGLIEQTLKKIVSEHDQDFIEVCPLNCIEQPINFLLNAKFLSNPPTCVSVTNLKGGYLIKFKKSYQNGEFKVINQKNFGDLLVTVFNENGRKISLETKNDFFAELVPTDCQNVEFYRLDFNKNLIAVAFNDEKTLLAIYDTTNKIKKIFFGIVNEFSFDNGICTTEHFLDIAKHTLRVNWLYQDGNLRENSRTITRSDAFNIDSLPERILPYAFLEEFMIQGEIAPYLESEILKNADKLHGFFGDFVGIMPPPSFRDLNEVGLIYNKKENVYTVNYFSFELSNRKICTIKQTD